MADIGLDFGVYRFSNEDDPCYTYVDLNNPAKVDFVIDTIELRFKLTDGVSVKVGTAYGSGNKYTIRDFVFIGDVPKSGFNDPPRIFTDLHCVAKKGDFVCLYCSAGNIGRDTTGFAGTYYNIGDLFDYTEHTYILDGDGDHVLAVHGIGTTGGETMTVTFTGQVSAQASSGEEVTIKVNGLTNVITQTQANGSYSTTFEGSAGDYTAQAFIPADALYEAAQSPVVPFSIGKQPRTITLNIGS